MSAGAERPPKLISVDEMFGAMKQAGIFGDNERIRRVIIDLDVKNKAVVMHVERYGDERLLAIAPLLTNAEIITGTPG